MMMSEIPQVSLDLVTLDFWKTVLIGFGALSTGFLATLAQYLVSKKHLTAKQIESVSRSKNVEGRTLIEKIDEITRHTQIAGTEKEIVELKRSILDIVSQDRTSQDIENLISEYHEQALNQARAQFWFSVAAATVGFIWILYAGVGITAEIYTAFKTLPGIVMNAVAFLFFRQASETRQRATDLYDRLRSDNQRTESIALVSTIEGARVRSAVKAQMALHMAGLVPSPINLMNFTSITPELHQAQVSSANPDEITSPLIPIVRKP